MLRTDSPKTLDILARQKERLDGIIVLSDLTALDFERFLTVLDSKYVYDIRSFIRDYD
jgi:hypothetical protein